MPQLGPNPAATSMRAKTEDRRCIAKNNMVAGAKCERSSHRRFLDPKVELGGKRNSNIDYNTLRYVIHA